MVSYWATIVTEAVIGILDLAKAGNQVIRRQNEEDILLRVLPVLNEGLAMRKVPDLRVGCYMVLTVLASQMNLDDAVLIAMMEAVASNWTLDTTNAGLICLSVLAQQRENVKLPKKVFKAIMSIESLETDILALNARYQVGNLTLGLILGILKGLGGDHDTYNLKFVRTAIENGLMDDTLVSTAVKSILATADTSNPSRFYGLDVQGELADLILRLADSETVRVNVQNVIANATIDMRQLEMKLRTVLSPVIGPEQLAIQDTAMGDAIREARIETFETAVDLIPTRTAYETSFLSHSESYVFGSLSHAFQLASDSPSTLKRFMELPVLRKSLGSTEPLFLTFFVRIWCGQYSNSVRAAAIACITIYLKDGPVTRDLQFLLPYIIYGLGDASAIVRQTTTDLALALSSTYTRGNSNDGKEHNREVLGKEQIYGQGEPTNSISWLSTGQVIGFIDQVLILNLEELRLDPSYISRLVAGHLNGPRANGPKLAKKDLKTSLRIDLLWFLSTHVSGTPLYSVKIRLLSLLNGVEKVGSISRTDTLLPVLISHENIDGKILQTACQNEKLEEASVYSHLVAVVLPRNEKGIDVLRRIISRERSSSPPLLMKAALHRIRHIWGSVKPDQQLLLASTCLDLIFNNSVQDSYLEQEEDALETLQTVTLSAAILLAFLESVPSLSDRASVQSASKRRRTLQGPVGREPAHLDKELQENLRKITVILELVDGSEAGTNPHLLADLFGVLADIHHLRSQLGTQMAYVQSLALGCLNRIVEAAAVS
jgi:U3 small nucleolar RNA-associated protein 10